MKQNIPEISIRIATPDDAKSLLAIYAPYVKNTAISFEYDVPSVEEFRQRIVQVLTRYPYIVAVKDGKPIGYAYAGAFKSRAAYNWSVEVSIYIDSEYHKCGVGRKLYATLEAILKQMNITNVNACIAYPEREDEFLTKNSVDFHKHLGFSLVGEFHKCAYKFNHWYNMVWMEKQIGIYQDKPDAMIPFINIRQTSFD